MALVTYLQEAKNMIDTASLSKIAMKIIVMTPPYLEAGKASREGKARIVLTRLSHLMLKDGVYCLIAVHYHH